jgi:zinc/manganese transport system ATP-binding protein
VNGGSAASGTHGDPVVCAHDLAAAYGGRVVWSQATFDIAAGSFVAVLGPNGAGKSTLLRQIVGLLPTAAGSLEVFGERPRRGNPAIGYVPQARTIDPELPLRGLDLVRLGVDGHRFGFPAPGPRGKTAWAAVERAVAAVGADGYADRKLGAMSGGERQRLLLAQALVGEPALLLLDEPLASLDVRNQAAMVELVSSLAAELGLTVLFVAHDLNPLRSAIDVVFYVAGGRVAFGPPDEVISAEVLSRLYGAPVEVLIDSRGRRFVVGIEEEAAHPHDHGVTPGGRGLVR